MYSKGNPTLVGQDISMSWVNGREMKSYKDTSKNLEINYKYNHEGIREYKIINGTKTECFLENENIIYQQTEKYMLYFMRDINGNLIGFKHNEKTDKTVTLILRIIVFIFGLWLLIYNTVLK